MLWPTTSENNILETTNEKEDSIEINSSNVQITSESTKESTTLESTNYEQKLEPTTSMTSTAEPKQEQTISETTTSEKISEPNTSIPKQEPSTSVPKQVPNTFKLTTYEPIPEPTNSVPRQKSSTSEPTTHEPKEMPTTYEKTLESITSEPKKEPTTYELSTEELKPLPSISGSTTSLPREIPTTSWLKPAPTTYEPNPESTISEQRQIPSTSEKKSELSTEEPKPEPTSEIKPEPSTEESRQLPSTSEQKQEHTTYEQFHKPSTSQSKQETTTSEIKTTQYSIVTTSINKPKTEVILTTILNHINLTSIASTVTKIPTTLIESKIETTIIEYNPATAVLVYLSHFLNFISYFTFYIHFRSINGFILSSAMTMSVQLINNRLLRILQNHQAKCKKTNDDLENAVYLCTVVADISTVNNIKIESDFTFESQDIKVVGISPIAHTLMDNVQNATEEYDTLLQSLIFILDHSFITANKRNTTFNITGIIDEPNATFEKTDLLLKVNTEKEKEVVEADINCTIVSINGSNYTLNCLGEKDVLYDLQSAISFYNNNILLINFDENITSEIIFSSDSYKFRKKDSGKMSAGVIVAIVLVALIALTTIVIVTLIFLGKKRFWKKNENAQDSAIVDLTISKNY